MRTNNDLKRIGDSSPNPGGRQLSGWGLGYGAGRSQAQTYFHNKMGHSAVHEYLQTLRRWYKVKRREAPLSQPTCSSGALWSVGCFGCANSRLSSVIAQKQMCAKYRTLPSDCWSQFLFGIFSVFQKKSVSCLDKMRTLCYNERCMKSCMKLPEKIQREEVHEEGRVKTSGAV